MCLHPVRCWKGQRWSTVAASVVSTGAIGPSVHPPDEAPAGLSLSSQRVRLMLITSTQRSVPRSCWVVFFFFSLSLPDRNLETFMRIHFHFNHHLTSSWRGGREERGASPSPALPSTRSLPPQTQRRSCRGCLFAQCVSMFCAANHFSISNDECPWEDQRSAAGSQRKGLDWKCFERDSKKTSEIRTLRSDEQHFEATVDHEHSEDMKTKGCAESTEFKFWLSRKC